MLYVPGNHDPANLMKNGVSVEDVPQLSDRSLNIHHRVIKLDKGLYIAGLGGSCPCFEVKKDLTQMEIWDPLPWTNEDDLYFHLKALIKQVEQELVKGSSVNKQGEDSSVLILFTHMGPRTSSTTVILDSASVLARKDNTLGDEYLKKGGHMPGAIYSGSTALDKIIMEGSHVPIILNIHGHSHMPSTCKMSETTTVVGPGSLGYEGEWA